MSDWRDDAQEERPHFAPSTLDDGDEMTVQFQDDGGKKDTRAGETTVFQVVVLDAPANAEDMNEEPLEEGGEYTLMTSSSRLLFNLSEFADDLSGQHVTIQASGPSNSYDRDYSVSAA